MYVFYSRLLNGIAYSGGDSVDLRLATYVRGPHWRCECDADGKRPMTVFHRSIGNNGKNRVMRREHTFNAS
jgi:hypothetical protein